MPAGTPLRPRIFGALDRGDYTVAAVEIQPFPGFCLCGNLFRPWEGAGPFPGILCPHGHHPVGRLAHDDIASVPGYAIGLARRGCVAFTYDL